MNPPTIHILGAGAIGLTFAYFLRQADIDVTLILRDEKKLALFQQQGGFYYQIEEQTHFIRCDAVLATHLSQPIAYLIVCTKAFDVTHALTTLQHLLTEQTKILLCHNGLGVLEQVQNLLPNLAVNCAITTMGAYQQGSFDIVMNGFGKTTLENVLFLELLQQTTLDIDVEPEFEKMNWQKFIINCAINPLTAIYQCRNGELLQATPIKMVMQEIIREVIEIASSQDIQFDVGILCEKVFSVAAQTRTNYSSMLQDVTRKQITEIDYLNGHVVYLAKQCHKNVPYNLTLTNIIRRLHHDYT